MRAVVLLLFLGHLATVTTFLTPANAQTAAQIKRAITPDTPLNRQLVAAVEQNDVRKVQMLLEQGASADVTLGMEGRPQTYPLFYTTRRFDARGKAIFRLLAKRLRDPNAAAAYESALTIAAEINDEESVRSLVERGADVNQAAGWRTPLGGALHYRESPPGRTSRVLLYLLERGANPNQVPPDGTAPLTQAALTGSLGAVRALLAHGANPARRDGDGRTALRWASSRAIVAVLLPVTPLTLHEAAHFDQVGKLRAMLQAAPAGKIDTIDGDGQTPLLWAVQGGATRAARLLIAQGANVSRANRWKQSPLLIAAQNGQTDVAQALLDRGADTNARDQEGRTPLVAATQAGRLGVVRLLLERGAVLHKQDQGQKAYFAALAALGGVIPGAPVAPQPPRATPAPLAAGAPARAVQNQIIALLKTTLRPDARREARSHALYRAAHESDVDKVRRLLGEGANVNWQSPVRRDADHIGLGETPLLAAIEPLSYSAQTVRELEQDKDPPAPGVLDGWRYDQRCGERTVDLLLQARANVNLADAGGRTPLMAACDAALPRLAADLIRRGARVDAADVHGRTALLRVCAKNDVGMAGFLLRRGANVNRQTRDGTTALMLAIDDGANARFRANWQRSAEILARRPRPEYQWPYTRRDLPNPEGHPNLVRLLLRHKADPNRKNKRGETALTLARREGFDAVVTLLLAAGAKQPGVGASSAPRVATGSGSGR